MLIPVIMIMQSCEKDYFYEIPPPHVATATSSLEAQYVSSAPVSLNSPYWLNADYLKVSSKNVSIQQLFSDGLLNMTGTYDGLNSFNGGKEAQLTLKAAYDANKVYLLAEWTDSDINLSQASWLWNGPADPLKPDLTSGWTSQRNNDQIAFAFEVQAASSQAGNFSNVGCAAACHGSGITAAMHPDAGKVDIWKWSLAHSAPMGYAIDMIADQNALMNDAGTKMYERNVNGTTDRSGPLYEWSGATQSVTLANGLSATLDPAYYLFNKTPFTGDIVNGDSLYHNETLNQPGHCNSCHGEHGEGATASAINSAALNKKSRSVLMSNMDNVADMSAYWNNNLTASQKDDIIAYLRGLSGVPGYYLQQPNGSNADITAISNVTPVQIASAVLPATNVHTNYKVLIIRNLKTNNPDDVQLDPSLNRTYKFGVALMDNDGKNHIGSVIETLTFK
jgi:mono/diheme cytochrome c family protein